MSPTSDSPDPARAPDRKGIGPILYLHGVEADRLELCALIVAPAGDEAPPLATPSGPVTGRVIAESAGLRVWRYGFSLPAVEDAWYEADGIRYAVNAGYGGDLRIAFVSCNGQENGDRKRPRDERNALWQRLAGQHEEAPFHLMIHGGDQIYADELAEAHPLSQAWAEGRRKGLGPVDDRTLEEVRAALREAFFLRYVEVLGEPETAWLMARVPSLAMWDDHDICDGWGSLEDEKMEAPVGRTLYEVARESFMIFQLGSEPQAPSPICLDATGKTLTWHARLPGLHVIAPDLRSERTRNRVMGEAGWRALDEALSSVDEGRVLLLSSVPALGPRLSWVERVMHVTPRMEKYEDDLRDQWQSRAHRAEWRRFLERLAATHANPETPVTVVSGEIHLATRGTFDVPPAPMHQCVASGITHPEPPLAYARGLGALARLGETPVPGHAVRLHPLPGQTAVYTAQRNYLLLERRDGEWRTWWELEKDGPTPALQL